MEQLKLIIGGETILSEGSVSFEKDDMPTTCKGEYPITGFIGAVNSMSDDENDFWFSVKFDHVIYKVGMKRKPEWMSVGARVEADFVLNEITKR